MTSPIGDFPLRISSFDRCLVEGNGLDALGFCTWRFHWGMLFGTSEKWWGDKGLRRRPHEGIDFCLFRDINERDQNLNPGIRIPLMYDGEVVKIDDDYLAKSVYAMHPIYDGNGSQLLSAYAHVIPLPSIDVGSVLHEGEMIATIADLEGKRSLLSPHLHVSMAWVPSMLSHECIDWDTLANPDMVTLLDPLDCMSCQYLVIP